MVKLYAEHIALVTWLPSTHLPFQFSTITAMNTLKRNPRYALFVVFGESVWLSSPFPLPMGLFGISPCQESATHLYLAFAGSWKPLQWADKAVVCSMGWVLAASTMGEGAAGLFILLFVAQCTWQGGKGVWCGTSCWNYVFRFGPPHLCWGVKMQSPFLAQQRFQFVHVLTQ